MMKRSLRFMTLLMALSAMVLSAFSVIAQDEKCWSLVTPKAPIRMTQHGATPKPLVL
jgi:hypothetical protein